MKRKKGSLNILAVKFLLLVMIFLWIVKGLSSFIKISRDKNLLTALNHLDQNNQENNFDILFFSNSQVYTTFDPLYIKHLTGKNALLLASPSQSLFFTLITIEKALQNHSPDKIVISLTAESSKLPDDQKAWFYNSRAMRVLEPDFSKFWTFMKLIPHVKAQKVLLEGLSSFAYALCHLNEWKNYKVSNPSKNVYSDSYLGFIPKRRPNNNDFNNYSSRNCHNKNEKPNLFFDTPTREFFKDFLNKLKRKGIDLVIVSPIVVDSTSELNFMQDVGTIIEEVGMTNKVKLIDLNQINNTSRLNVGKNEFYDCNHLNHLGALKVTKYFCEEIFGESNNLTKIHPKLNYRKNLNLNNYQLLIDDNFQKVVQLYLNDIPRDYLDYNTVINVIPFSDFKHKLIDSTSSSDASYLKVKEYFKLADSSYLAHIPLDTELKSSEIERIDLWFYKPNSFGSGKHSIYKSNLILEP
ncbi:hypothetical protein QYS48_30870 [Marivirga arenosa]|uniref:DUF1574 domain-containing protein n=1 Tax=Marivirga arenosa TaxID=3059076 RepID=A0AA51N8T4_9BACT|nr:hypothetical protein [Marivirga sp. ABR2-2]WMN08054.1 hypothetical protein QYS48_30870 [Marivirga sp. ABR2-2]